MRGLIRRVWVPSGLDGCRQLDGSPYPQWEIFGTYDLGTEKGRVAFAAAQEYCSTHEHRFQVTEHEYSANAVG